MNVFASTTPGLEPALLQEIQMLGWSGHATEGGVEISGPDALYRQANLRLRTANRVLLRVSTFVEARPRGLTDALSSLDLRPYVASGAGLRLKYSGDVGAPSAPEIAGALRRALRQPSARVEPFEEEAEADGDLGLFIRVRSDGTRGLRMTVSVDTSGGLLYRRGYRQEVSRAPLRETLAAGLLLLAGYDGRVPFCDPMCGSGTLLIEAALMAMRKAPGQLRHFAFERFPSHDAQRWAAEKDAARREEQPPPAPLRGSDLHAGALGTARRNARRAGVLSHVALERLDATRLGAPTRAQVPGVVVTNPPYGMRVGESDELEGLYTGLGETFRSTFSGWRVGVLVPQGKLEGAFGIAFSQRFAVSNGGIRCAFLATG